MKEEVVKILSQAINNLNIDFSKDKIFQMITTPPSHDMGDFAFPCFALAEKRQEEVTRLALEIRGEIKKIPKTFEAIETKGPYINFFLNRKEMARSLIQQILLRGDNYGKSVMGKSEKTMLEYPSPNTNKPLHIGHLRNICIGQSMSNILEFHKEKIIHANLNNDRGIHICKSMAAYKLYGKNKKPGKRKSDHFVGDFYVMFGQKEKHSKKLELESHRLLQKWESQDKETLELWSKMNKWAFDGFNETYKKLDIKFDREYYESQIYEKGKQIVEEGLKKKIFTKRKDGAVEINLGKKLGKKILLRMDGTSVYMTQDLYLAILKSKQYKLTKSIYITGNEQDYHFEVLFKILEKLGFKNLNMQHLSYGMVNLPTGKIKSREGTKGITIDEILDNTQKIVKKELTKREKLGKKELEKRSKIIALSAIRYALLKIDMKRNMIFNPEKSTNFEGDTGPYLLYSYARANSILKKVKAENSNFEIQDLESVEIKLIKKLENFQETLHKSYKEFNPALIANYSYELCQIFNEFYHECPVLHSDNSDFRINLVKSFKQILKNSLDLLEIKTLEKM